jgi:hypothetical protein
MFLEYMNLMLLPSVRNKMELEERITFWASSRICG